MQRLNGVAIDTDRLGYVITECNLSAVDGECNSQHTFPYTPYGGVIVTGTQCIVVALVYNGKRRESVKLDFLSNHTRMRWQEILSFPDRLFHRQCICVTYAHTK